MTSQIMESVKPRASQRVKIEPVVENDLQICGMTASKERAAWYCYDAGNSLFSGLAMTFLVPLLLSELARMRASIDENGVDIPSYSCEETANGQWTVDCGGDMNGKCREYDALTKEYGREVRTTCTTCIIGAGTRLWQPNNNTGVWELTEDPRTVPFLGMDINYITYTSLIISISVLAQVFVFITHAPLADYGKYRKQLLLVCTFLGSMCISLFMVAEDINAYLTVGVLTVLANMFFGLGVVAYNSFLPILVDAHEKLCDIDVAALSQEEKNKLLKFRMDHQGEMSSKAYIYGYIGQFVGLLFACAIIFNDRLWSAQGGDATNYRNYRTSMLFVGLWCLLWSLPALLWLKPRASPPVPVRPGSPCSTAVFGWTRMVQSWRLAKKHRNSWRMLASLFFYSDMYSTIAYVGILIAKDRMCFDTSRLVLLEAIVVLMCILGINATLYIRSTWNVSVKGIIVAYLMVYAGCSVWGLCGVWRTDIGLRQPWELYVFAAIHGFAIGPIQSYSRVLFADFIPIGHESSFFSIYGIMEKAPRCIGPIIIGIIVQAKADIRYTFLYLFVFAVASALLLHFCIDHEKGMVDAGRVHVSRTSSKHEAERAHVEVTSRAVDVESVEDLRAAPM
eukprot:GEMP01002343.1.p1 GENE.GEMP01002343.1~~GEMP01002343.1.p1  ORF type:complete len:621 (-),score=94.47 GEMP01002343.1:1402-3264(-)